MSKKERLKLDIISNIDEKIIQDVSQKRIQLSKYLQKPPVWKRGWVAAAAIAALLALTVGLLWFFLLPTKQIPIYTGMTVSGEVPTSAQARYPDQAQYLSVGAGDFWKDPAEKDKEKEKEKKEKLKKALQDKLDAQSAESLYYAKPGEEVYVTIHIDNPDDFEILSFTLNGQKYSSYMFEDGSDMENIIIKVNVGDASGIAEYTIDAIKYVDGTKIKDVRMDGDRTVRVGIYTENQPTVKIESETLSYDRVSFDVTASDPESLIAMSHGKLFAVLYEGENVMEHFEIEVGEKATVSFANLIPDTAYQYALVAYYDAFDGNGMDLYILEQKEVTTLPTLSFESLQITQEEIAFALDWNAQMQEKTLLSLKLYQNGSLVKELATNATKAEGLLSNTAYTLVAEYSRAGITETVTVEFTTLAKVAPTVSLEMLDRVTDLENNKLTVQFNITSQDADGVISSYEASLYQGDTLIAKQENQPQPLFADLNNSSEHIMELTYHYDLNDGKGVQTQKLTMSTWETSKGLAIQNGQITGIGSCTDTALYINQPMKKNVFYGDNQAGVPQIEAVFLTEKVKSISDRAFQNCSNLKRVVISDGVTSIESHAFWDCTSLESISIPNSVKNIPTYVFGNCRKQNAVYYAGTAEEWCKMVFSGLYSLPANYDLYFNNVLVTDLVIPDGVTSIDKNTFRGCTSLKSVIIPDSVTSIGESAFYNCTELKSVVIGNGVTSIGKSVFVNKSTGINAVYYAGTADEWAKITIDSSNTGFNKAACYYYSETEPTGEGTYWHYVDGVPTAWTILQYVSNGDGTCSIIEATGNGVLVIPERSPDGDLVTEIGAGAFKDSTFAEIIIPNSVKSIGISAFEGCTSLTSITIPDSVTSIVDKVFYNCTGLTSITIPNSVTSIGNSAIRACTSLTSIIIPDSVTSIGYGAFYDCSSLTSITIPDGVTSIEGESFIRCTGLTSVTIGNGVTIIDAKAFFYCTSLTSITIPDSVTSIGSSAFYNCTDLKAVYYTGTAEQWEKISVDSSSNSELMAATRYYYSETEPTGDGSYWHYVDGALTVWPMLQYVSNGDGTCSISRITGEGSVLIPERSPAGDLVTGIGDGAFRGSTVTEVIIPDSVTSIGSRAFYNCTNLTGITIPKGVTSIGDYAFEGCTGLTSVTIGNGVTSIGNYAFIGCTSLTSITIPDSVTSIGTQAFYNCTGLTSITIPDSVTSIGNYAFIGCTSLTSITIPDSVTSIGNYAFEGCTGLTSVTIGNGVTSIGSRAFYNCTSLTSITIPDSVTSIGNYAFEGCTSLTSITIPDSITSIGKHAFEGCTGLKIVYITDLEAWYKIAFFSPQSNPMCNRADLYLNNELVTELTIPNGVTIIGDYAFFGCTSLTSITISDSVTSFGDFAFANCTNLTAVTLPFDITSIDYMSIFSGTPYLTGINPDSPGINPDFLDVWDGTADTSWFDINNIQEEYTLTTAEQFAGFFELRMDAYSKKGIFSGATDRYYFEGVTIKLACDIILNEGTAAEIKEKMSSGQAHQVSALNSNAYFKGVFDGQGHTIYGVFLDCTGTGMKGLFGGLGDNAVIKNLKIKNAYFNGSEIQKQTGGFLIARASGQNILISNVTIEDALMDEGTATFSGVGILVGAVDSNASLTMENCHTSGTISFPTMGTGSYGFGGIVGYVQDATLNMINCTSLATVIAPNNCGGLIGVVSAKSNVTLDSGCTFTGTIICEGENKSDYVGNNATIQPAN